MNGAVTVPGLNRRIRGEVYDHVFDNDDHEVGGVLVGRLGPGSLPVVTGSIAALEAEGKRASVTFTHAAWASIHGALERDFPDQQIVGWYHSHPGFGIFLSNHDRFIHDNFFSDERQIAYVVDPHAGTEGVFHWADGELVLLHERPCDRSGTGGHSTRPPVMQSMGRGRKQLALAGVALLLLGLVAVLVARSGGGSNPVPTRTEAAAQAKGKATPRGAPAPARGGQPTPPVTPAAPVTGGLPYGFAPTPRGGALSRLGAIGATTATGSPSGARAASNATRTGYSNGN